MGGESKEVDFKGFVAGGFTMLSFLFLLCVFVFFVLESKYIDGLEQYSFELGLLGMISIIAICFCARGFFILQPNEKRVMSFFGKYKGTFSRTGYFWVNPLLTKRYLSVRLRNLDIGNIKVNDKVGNPVMIGMVLVWRLRDSYKAVFELDAPNLSDKVSTSPFVRTTLAQFYSQFVRVQADAALRQVAGLYAYDTVEENQVGITLRDGGDVINQKLQDELNARLFLAGIEVVEARLNYLAYAPEIAQVMLRRQQAIAIIAAREKIVHGAVSMVKLAIDKLEEEKVLRMDDGRKVSLVSNLLVLLCADEAAQPIVNTGDFT